MVLHVEAEQRCENELHDDEMHILHDDVSDLIDDEVDEQTIRHDDSDEIE